MRDEGELIAELMLRWEEARRQGRAVSVEELCADCPQHAEELRRRIQSVQAMEHLLGIGDQGASRTVLSPRPAAKNAATIVQTTDGEPMPVIPGYEIVRLIDRGGMGVVYEARQVALGRTVAVKMISGGHLGPKVLGRFRVEAEAAARLQHANVVQVFEVGEVKGRPFFSMEYVAGGNLAALLATELPTPRQAAALIETLARAVAAAHERGIVHRDLKPSNVMLTADGMPKISDFGLAKMLDDESDHTRTGEILGTPSYMAPEQAEGRKDRIGPATDVYSLGTILYELLAGTPPFQGTSPLDAMRRVVTDEPVAPSRQKPSVPRDLDAVCLKCLEKAPGQRYGSALALADDLRRFLDGRPVTARHTGPGRRAWKWVRRHPQVVAWGGTVILVAVVLLSLGWGPYHAARELRARAEQQAPQARDILRRNCLECHGLDPKKVQKNFHILDHRDLLNPARRIVVPGAPEDSWLIQRIADGTMPPEEDEKRLPRISEEELTVLKDWIKGGAPPFPEDSGPLPIPEPSESATIVKEVFRKRCYECHSYDAAKGGIKIMHHRLLVTVRKVVVPGQPDESKLLELLLSKDPDVRMPKPPARRLPPEEIAAVRQWILDGAPPFPRNE